MPPAHDRFHAPKRPPSVAASAASDERGPPAAQRGPHEQFESELDVAVPANLPGHIVQRRDSADMVFGDDLASGQYLGQRAGPISGRHEQQRDRVRGTSRTRLAQVRSSRSVAAHRHESARRRSCVRYFRHR